MILKLVVLSNAFSFFGKELTKDGSFMLSALAYIEETLICAEIVRLAPKPLAPIIGGIIARRLKSHKTIFNSLLQIAVQRCLERDLKRLGHSVPKHADCIQWIMETSPRQKPWTPTRIVHELMAIWFGSVHALSTTITFAIHDLCLHPGYVEPLRRELQAEYSVFESTGKGLSLLDSFIKESARLTPVESNGTEVRQGDWVCTPVRAIMQSPEYYPDPLEFRGFRVADHKALDSPVALPSLNFRQPSPSKLTDVNQSWHVWGTGRMACPGRYYAVAINYELALSRL
ncbi:hypothetical protein DL769_011311 [Monosporascus sp. CRB-8-3]|nr:hypothetical protein DL769_011311 [Monosporascus sp. CRB-8-3]